MNLDYFLDDYQDIENDDNEIEETPPEFIPKVFDYHRKINVQFTNQESVNHFSKLVGKKISKKTLSIWFPTTENESTASLFFEE